jgi:hypothetical protein
MKLLHQFGDLDQVLHQHRGLGPNAAPWRAPEATLVVGVGGDAAPSQIGPEIGEGVAVVGEAVQRDDDGLYVAFWHPAPYR